MVASHENRWGVWGYFLNKLRIVWPLQLLSVYRCYIFYGEHRPHLGRGKWILAEVNQNQGESIGLEHTTVWGRKWGHIISFIFYLWPFTEWFPIYCLVYPPRKIGKVNIIPLLLLWEQSFGGIKPFCFLIYRFTLHHRYLYGSFQIF